MVSMNSDTMESTGLRDIQTKQAGKSHYLNSIVENHQKDCEAFSRESPVTQAVQTSFLMTSVRLLSSTAGLFRQCDGTTRR